MAQVYSPKPFGTYSPSTFALPSDTIQVDVYSVSNLYLDSITNLPSGSFAIDGSTVNVDLEKVLRSAQFLAGDFNVTIKLLRNFLGNADGHKVEIQDISADRLEARVIIAPNPSGSAVDFSSLFASKFFELNKQEVLSGLGLYTSPLEDYSIFDYVQDKITVDESPYSIIFRLNAPLPTTIQIGDLAWITQQVSTPIIDRVKIIPTEEGTGLIYIKGANFDAYNKKSVNPSTQYKSWDTLLGTDIKSQIVSSVFSGSFLEGIQLNIDHRQFENHIHFGNGEEQIRNFEYKVKLLEHYDGIIASLSTSLTGLVSGSSSGSFYFVSQSATYSQKRQALLGTLTSFERYMYYESSSYESSSLGVFLDIAWPKQNSTKPYILYSSTSSIVEDWFNGVISSASLYDYNNPHALTRLIPEHIRQDEANSNADLFVQMLGQYYDNFYTYIKHFNKIYDRQEKLDEGFAKDLVFEIARNCGVEFNNGNVLDELWSYTLGLDVTGSYNNNLSIPSGDITKETWKRVINNLPYLLKTKGTERGIRALINCFGIPQTILRIREYGGPEPEFDTTSKFDFEKFYYALRVGELNGEVKSQYDNSGSLYNNALYGKVPSHLYTVWLSGSNALELRFRPESGSTTVRQTLLQNVQSNKSAFQIDIEKGVTENVIFSISGSTGVHYLTISASLFDGRFNQLAINKTTNANQQTYTVYIKKAAYGKITETYSGSLTLPASSGSFSASWDNFGTLYIPGSPVLTNKDFYGDIQELRYWSRSLQESVINNHTLTPTSYVGNTDLINSGTTASFADLKFRITLGTDTNRPNLYTSGSRLSQQPDQLTSTIINFDSFTGSLADFWTPIEETNYLEWPDLAGNRSVSNKIRIDENRLIGTQLYPNTSVQRSAQDDAPIDSPRLSVALSPTMEINRDIAEQFGGISIDDYIGSPAYIYESSYGDLEDLERLYFKKWTGRYNTQTYINLLKYYDSALFALLEKFVPARANFQSGLVIENHLLKRNKVKMYSQPTREEAQYSASIDIPDTYIVGGAIQDGDAEPFRDMPGYVEEGVIDRPYVILEGDFYGEEYEAETINGTLTRPIVIPTAKQNEYNEQQVPEQPSDPNSTYGTIDVNITSYGRDKIDGTQYRFKTWYATGSSTINFTSQGIQTNEYGFALLDSIGEDYWNPIQPNITGSRPSSVFTNNTFHEDYPGDTDIFRGALSLTNSTKRVIFTGSVAGYSDLAIYDTYGFRFVTQSFSGNSNYFELTQTGSFFNYDNFDWSSQGLSGAIASGSGLFFQPGVNNTTGSEAATFTQSYMQIPAFWEYDITKGSATNYLIEFEYEGIGILGGFDDIGVMISTSGSWPGWGSTGPGIYRDYANGAGEMPVDWTFVQLGTGGYYRVKKIFRVPMKAYSPYLRIHSIVTDITIPNGNLSYVIRNLKVRPLVPAQLQDYQLATDGGSIGILNQKYNGCKLVSNGYNIDSPDTIDNGPVITIFETSPNTLTARPTNRNNLTNT